MSGYLPHCPHDTGEGECADCKRGCDLWLARTANQDSDRIESLTAQLRATQAELAASRAECKRLAEALMYVCSVCEGPELDELRTSSVFEATMTIAERLVLRPAAPGTKEEKVE